MAVAGGMVEDYEMDEDTSAHHHQPGLFHTSHGPNGVVVNGMAEGDHSGSTQSDVTLNQAISTNQAPVGGRKRCREEHDELEVKRIRKTGGCGSFI